MLVSETKNDRLCLLAEPVVLESCFGFGVEKLSLAFAGFRPVFAALRNTRRFTGAAPQIIELRTTDGALADDGNAVDVGRIEREDALDAFAERQLAHGEVRAHALVRARAAHALEILDAGALAFDDAPAARHTVARTGTEKRRRGKK